MSFRDRIDDGLGWWGRSMYRRHRVVLALSLAYVAVMTSLIAAMRFENASQSYLRSEDPASIRYDEFNEQFGQDDQILLAISPPDVFAPAFLEKLRLFHEALESELPHVTDVTSLINARDTRGEGDALVVDDLLAEWPDSPEAFETLRRRVFANPLYVGVLVSRDGRTTTITLEPDLQSEVATIAALSGFEESREEPGSEPGYLTDEDRTELLSALDVLVQRFGAPDFPIQMVGGPVTTTRVNQMMTADIRAYMGWAGAAIALFLLALFRRLSGVVLPMLVVLFATLSTLGTMVWLDIPFSLVLGMLPIFTLTVGVCTTVHILVIVYQQLRLGRSPEDSVAYAFHHSALAICMASATTAAGMLSFLSADVAPIRNLGVIAPIAVGYAFAFSMTTLPAMLAATPLRTESGERLAHTERPSERLLVWIGRVAAVHARPIAIGAIALTLLAVAGAARLRFSHDPVKWFPPDHPTRLAVETIDRALSGSSSAEVVIDTGATNGLHAPDTLKRIEAAMRFAESLQVGGITVGKAMSLVDIVEESHQALNQDSPEFRFIPESRQVIAQELLLFENGGSDDLEKFTDSRFRLARMNLRVPESDAIEYRGFLEALHSGLRETLGEDLEFAITGRTTLMARIFSALITSMGRSYVFALLVITPLMILLIGDLRLGLLSMAPNIFPVIFVLGVMGWLGIPLDVSNIVIGSILIGLAVDDTIHFLQRFRTEYADSGDAPLAIQNTMRGTGAALFFTSLVLATGFLVMALRGSMLNTVQFGLLSALGIAVAFLADVFITPALIALTATRSLPKAADENTHALGQAAAGG
jgi:predicted RND superfamily exporter protein